MRISEREQPFAFRTVSQNMQPVLALKVILCLCLIAMVGRVHTAEFEFKCVVKQSFAVDARGQLVAGSQFINSVFYVSRESGKFSTPSWPFFAAPSSRQQILHTGDRGEPFVVLSTNRSAEGGVNVELLSIHTYGDEPRKHFLAYGVAGNVYSGTCE